MKNIIISILVITSGLFLTSCEYDNYDPPKSFLTGEVLHGTEPVGVRSGATELELWQPGYELYQKIRVWISEDGSYSTRLFDGDYYLKKLGGAPWQASANDSILVQVRGNTTLNVPVTPFWAVEGASISAAGGTVTANVTVTNPSGTNNLSNVNLYVGPNMILNHNYNGQRVQIAGAAGANTITLVLNADLAGRDYIFARVGVLSNGSSERYYSQTVKIDL